MKRKGGRRPRGNPLQKMLAKNSAVLVKGHTRIGVNVNSLHEALKLGWKRVN